MKTYKSKIISPIKRFGGKSYSAKKIANQMERRSTFIEGFAGTCITSLVLDEVFDRHYCVDLDPHLINFWKVLKQYPERLHNFLLNTEYGEENFQVAKKYLIDNDDEIIEPFFDATCYFITNRMSRGADMQTFGWSNRKRRGIPEYISAYKSAVDNLPAIARKIQSIEFICDDYMMFIIDESLNEQEDVVQYLDPPYVHSSRTDVRPYKEYEMKTFCRDCSEGETSHECLASFLKTGVAGITYLSGYHSEEYSKWLEVYPYTEWNIANAASQSLTKPIMTEVLWKLG